jgi:serine beta-lactamase-like protein LACTB, mitochondrial
MAIRTKTILLSISLIVVAGIGYKMFEPLFRAPFGWQTLPDLSQPVGEQQLNDTSWQITATRAHALLHQAQQQNEMPAISIAVGIDGKLIWADAIGYADLANQQAVTLQSRFRIGSTSKAVTAVAVGSLLQQGKLDLDAPIQRYIPDYPYRGQPISTRQVMSHMAGVRHYALCWCFPVWEPLNTRHYSNLRDSLRPLENESLLFAPGSAFTYTSHGYNITGAVIEGASGQDFLSYLDTAVLQPLALSNTGADHADRDLPTRVRFYDIRSGQYKPSFAVDNSNKWPSGGLLSTPSDLVSLGNALLFDRLLTPAVKQQLFTPQQLNNGEVNPQNYALGWRHDAGWKLLDGRLITSAVHHGGTANGSSSWFVLYPEIGLTLSIMTNRSYDNVRSLITLGDAIAGEFIVARQQRRLAGQ